MQRGHFEQQLDRLNNTPGMPRKTGGSNAGAGSKVRGALSSYPPFLSPTTIIQNYLYRGMHSLQQNKTPGDAHGQNARNPVSAHSTAQGSVHAHQDTWFRMQYQHSITQRGISISSGKLSI
jgi:hypothetical protein